jgi:hypothetical protein
VHIGPVRGPGRFRIRRTGAGTALIWLGPCADWVMLHAGEITMTEQTHRLTPLAILSVFILTIPGCVIGQIVAFLYGHFLGGYLDGNLFDWITGGWFQIITMAILPNAISGGVGGYFGLRVTFAIKPLKQANYEIAAYAMSAVVVLISVFGLYVLFVGEGMSVKVLENVANAAGIIVGLFVGYSEVAKVQESVTPEVSVPAQ